ncbi:MAG: gas vesicle protein GvpG [Planctomycetota bacterium]
MLLVDDILLFPIKGIFYVFKQIHNAAEADFLDEEGITNQLSELYMMLETDKITEEEFNEKEGILLDRLDEIEEYKKAHYGIDDEEDAYEDDR